MSTQDTSLQELATQCLDEAGGDRKSAAGLLYSRLDDNQKAQLLERYLDKAIWDLLRRLGPTQRRTIDHKVPAMPSARDSDTRQVIEAPALTGLMRLAKANLDNLLDGFRLTSGVILGDAGRTELLEEAAREHSQATIHVERSMFLRSVASRVGSAARVRNAIDNDELRRLALSTIQEVAA